MKNIFEKIIKAVSSKTAMTVLTFLGIYLFSTGISYAIFSFVTQPSGTGTSSTAKDNRAKIASLPKTEACPINGLKYTKFEEDVWQTRRPIAAIIENHLDSRPQSGLSRADIVYEAVAEGGITRFLGIFYCGASGEEVKVAPVRSARIYFVNLAAGYGDFPIFLHQGGANNFCPECPGGVKTRGQVDKTVDAYAALDKLGWRNGQLGNDMDGGFNVGMPVLWRNQYRLSSEAAAWEHSVVASLDETYKEASKRGFNFKDEKGNAWNKNFREWKFEDGKVSSSPVATSIKFGFWDGEPEYDVEWKYDASSNLYKRFNGGAKHIDWEFDKPQLSASNVLIMFAKEKNMVDKEGHQYYEVIGQGEALVFMNGEVVKGTWEKDSQLDREVFYDKNGDEMVFTGGLIWIEVVPFGNKVSY